MTAVLSDAEVVLADYSGLTSNELNELKSTREAGVFVKLVKNNMLKRFKESQFSSMSESISGCK